MWQKLSKYLFLYKFERTNLSEENMVQTYFDIIFENPEII